MEKELEKIAEEVRKEMRKELGYDYNYEAWDEVFVPIFARRFLKKFLEKRVGWLLEEIEKRSDVPEIFEETVVSVADVENLIKKAFSGVLRE